MSSYAMISALGGHSKLADPGLRSEISAAGYVE